MPAHNSVAYLSRSRVAGRKRTQALLLLAISARWCFRTKHETRKHAGCPLFPSFEEQHVGPKLAVGRFAITAVDLILGVSLTRHGGKPLNVIFAVVGVHPKPRLKQPQSLVGSAEGVLFSTFNVRLDEVNPGKLQTLPHVVERIYL